MILVAARATKGVQIPSEKQSRKHIMKVFKTQTKSLSERLNVCMPVIICNQRLTDHYLSQSAAVIGETSLTCDAWSASNTDSYFAITGHCTEEQTHGNWKLQHALLSFTKMNTAYEGVRLGLAMFRICSRLRIIHKVRSFLFFVQELRFD